MAVPSEVFAATHQGALAHAAARSAGRTPTTAGALAAPQVTSLDLEVLGEVAARAVRFGAGDLELEDVDLEHEDLFRLPRFLCEVLLELGADEDPETLPEVAAAWAASEEMAADGEDLTGLVRGVVDVVRRAEEAGQGVYLWVGA